MAARSAPLLLSWFALTSATSLPSWRPSIVFPSNIAVEAGGVHNLHLQYTQTLHGSLSIYYGDCDTSTPDEYHHALGSAYVGAHALAKREDGGAIFQPTTFVWLPPDVTPSNGCLHATVNDRVVGRSTSVTVRRRPVRRSIDAANMLDVEGPWFDGVSYLQAKEPGSAFVASSKKQRIGIIGAGMAGLMTGHLLDSVGIHNWTILEASNRLGGRVLTAYLNGTRPDQYQYQEMGGMRFPVSVQDPETGKQLPIKDHRMVFQLADVLNNQNGNVSTYKVKFIPWTQEEPNDPADTLARRPDGTVPGAGSVGSSMYEVEDADSPVNINQTMSLGASAQAAESAYYNWTGIMQPQTFRLFVKNIFEAHRQAVDAGYFDWSESRYIWHVLNKSINTTDDINTIANNNPSWLYENIYGAATQWLTVDQGLSRLPQAFEPQVLNRTQFNTSVQGIAWNGSSVIVKHTPTDQPASKQRESAFDHVITSVPFSLVRLWDLPPYSSLLSRAIQNLQYTPVCKVALRYKTRFWEHLPQPILGGCGAVNISGIGNICYPSYKINSTGPGVLLGSYVLTEVANSLAALSDAAHIALVQRAMVSIHGPVAEEQYTGEEFNSIFIGEHTSYTQAWVWSALESSVRGTTQLLLDLGLVDEAKMIVDTWMARWMRL